MSDLSTRYVPAEHEQAVYKRWIDGGVFHADPSADGQPYCIVIPPPNVTAALHLGHALNNTLQDVLVRLRRMQGRNALWMPGTDHAGIATQTVVEKRLLSEEGKRRTEYARDEFVSRVQAWKDEYERRIIDQLRAMGCSCDWDRTRFTMDEVCARAVREMFFKLFEDGLIYRGKRLVNWDPATQTVLADDEVEHETVHGHFYYLKYPLAQAVQCGDETIEHVTVATTRPETMLGDTAVAMNPADPRAKALGGKRVKLPIVGRLIPIVLDDHVVMPDPEGDEKAKFSTGFLKVTPAHDPDDYQIGQRHELPMINVMAPDGTISDKHGWDDARGSDAEQFLGMDRFEAREGIVEWFRQEKLLAEVRDYTHEVGHSYRSHVPIEPYLSDQWYVAVKKPVDRLASRFGAGDIDGTEVPKNSLAGLALAPLVEGKLKFTPERYGKTYRTWLENLRDWPISRQLWWGHRIPIWSKPVDERPIEDDRIDYRTHEDEDGQSTTYACVAADSEELEQKLESFGFVRDEDVLDTWFSSALWPFSTLEWPEESDLLKTFYPGNVLCTAREIITLWVSRMVMMGQYALGEPPFEDVFIHAMIQDGEGRKMSKSLGNGIDPLDIIDSHGADAMRFTLCSMTTHTQDVRMPVETMTLEDGRQINTSPKFDLGRNFANKLWNAARFVLGSLEDEPAELAVSAEELTFSDRWILVRLAQTADEVTASLVEEMSFNTAITAAYDFLWRDFCDWYLELSKPRMNEGGRAKAVTQRVLGFVLDQSLRLLHPFVPFVTETLWEKVSAQLDKRTGGALLARKASPMLAQAAWPAGLSERFAELATFRGHEVAPTMELLQGIVRSVRNVRARMGLSPKDPLTVVIACDESTRALLEANRSFLTTQATVGELSLAEPEARPESSALEVFGALRVFVKLDPQLIDQERKRLEKKIQEARGKLKGSAAKLSNENFVTRAKPEVIQRARDLHEKLEQELAGLEENLEQLS